ncbi:hypothetical protein RRG08_018782 [Elysia crispata]|uniref:Uncharacterized protein n=1 Tax=Elysia crispata TaxID=231223 RepID=A0AAE1AQR4_9GAST|nr:hypothetical protein RRG08_018782 [Elysia crispata]
MCGESTTPVPRQCSLVHNKTQPRSMHAGFSPQNVNAHCGSYGRRRVGEQQRLYRLPARPPCLLHAVAMAAGVGCPATVTALYLRSIKRGNF